MIIRIGNPDAALPPCEERYKICNGPPARGVGSVSRPTFHTSALVVENVDLRVYTVPAHASKAHNVVIIGFMLKFALPFSTSERLL